MNSPLKKILYIHNQSFSPPGKGGLNTTLLQVFSMCNAFARQGLEVILFMEGAKDFQMRLSEFEKNAFSEKLLFRVSFWNKRHNNRLINRFLIAGQIRNCIAAENPDLVFTREAALLRALLKTGKKIIYESHNARQHKRFIIIHKLLQNEITRASRKDNFLCLVSISQALMDYWKTHNVSSGKLFAWHDGFDTSLFNQPISKVEARENLQLPEYKVIITYTGGLYPDREIENIIALAGFFPDKLFLVIGGPEKNKDFYQKIAKEADISNISFLGFMDHSKIPAYLYASDVLLALWSSKVPTINYCSPLKLFEYMASGRLIVAHAFPTIKEVLKDNENAILIQPDSQQDLIKGIERALANQNDHLGSVARELAFSRFTWDNRASAILREVLKNN